MVSRLVWDQDAAGSSPVASTISSIHKGFDFMNTRFFMNHDGTLVFVCNTIINYIIESRNSLPSVRFG